MTNHQAICKYLLVSIEDLDGHLVAEEELESAVGGMPTSRSDHGSSIYQYLHIFGHSPAGAVGYPRSNHFSH